MMCVVVKGMGTGRGFVAMAKPFEALCVSRVPGIV